MGTRWRGLLAPINVATGDARRFKAFTHRTLPLPHRWQRMDEQGHDASVIVGMSDAMANLTVADAITTGWISQEAADRARLDPAMMAVFGQGEFFDDADPIAMPRLREDVAEAMLLAGRGVLGPSVGPGAVEVYGWVHAGTDDLITEDEYIESMVTGKPVDEELLFSSYEIAESTLVPVPAFAETSQPFEILSDQPAALTAAARTPEYQAARAAIVAAAAAEVAAPPIPADVFDAPPEPEFQPVRVEDRGEGFLRVAGYLAAFSTCHVGYRDACYTAPPSELEYAPFNRYPIDVVDGSGAVAMVTAGRITTGLGKVGPGCTCCRGKDDHACDYASLGAAIDHHDRLRTVAHVRATEIPGRGIWLAGYAPATLSVDERAVLGRQRMSGDWRPQGGNLELVEALALAREQPGFPIPARSGFRHGRQLSLVAAGRVLPDTTAARRPAGLDPTGLAREISDMVVQGLRTAAGLPAMVAADAPTDTADAAEQAPQQHTGAMVALVPSADDATRLAVDGGEPAGELHATRAYLGEGADWSPEDQAAVIDAMRQVAAGLAPVVADAFAVSMFNPTGEDPCVVLGLCGPDLAAAQDACMAALEPFAGQMPDQHVPHVEHITLQYTSDPAQVAAVMDRAGTPVTLDRLRVAFAGETTDIPLGAAATSPDDAAAELAAEVDAVLAGVGAGERTRQATLLARQIEEVTPACAAAASPASTS